MTTFVFIHGGGGSGWEYHLVEPELRRRGHDVVAPDMPTEDDALDFEDYADAVVAEIGDRRDLVVVGHSFGGFTAPLMCERVPVRLLVMLSAMIPKPGENPGDWWAKTGHVWPEGDDIAMFLHDVPRDLAEEALRRGRDQSGTPTSKPWPLAKWPDVPTRYLMPRDDRFFTPEFIRPLVRERLGITEPDEMGGSHCVYLSRPVELAEKLIALSEAES
ncbi:alpha/beta hydrolase family protein [Herbihabitans rhizosphaerae]|uniref:Alpha/beta hydrolase family protein n=1 Tax=Herbihabitans rhizosphaerae TaxID=1872711 RepID=A0A4Q7L2E2_9PSEU|nr:alpha/beta hydrolase [Herbihabitans rhizosphaerae]RZS43718.1 alpha/beta hydrolase family protein [Herbihabitans rhizosphaerae]